MYRPSENRVIDVAEVAPVVNPTPQPEVAGATTSSDSADTIITTPKVLIEANPSTPPAIETSPTPNP